MTVNSLLSYIHCTLRDCAIYRFYKYNGDNDIQEFKNIDELREYALSNTSFLNKKVKYFTFHMELDFKIEISICLM